MTAAVVWICFMAAVAGMSGNAHSAGDGVRKLPPAAPSGTVSVEQAIAQRRSVRSFDGRPVGLEQIGQLCWAGQGITEAHLGLRASPSAGALYPMELFVVTSEGVERYDPDGHRLQSHVDGDLRRDLRKAALDQEAVGQAPLCIVVVAVVERSARKYGQRAERYCHIEAGHIGQNILLQAEALGLAGVPVGAFEDDGVRRVLKLPGEHRVLYLLPIGHPAE